MGEDLVEVSDEPLLLLWQRGDDVVDTHLFGKPEVFVAERSEDQGNSHMLSLQIR